MLPIGSRDTFRIKVYGRGRPRNIEGRMDLFGTDIGIVVAPAEYSGCLLVPRWEDVLNRLPFDRRRSYRWKSEDLRFQVVGTVYKALRQMMHVMCQYGIDPSQGEKSVMLEIRRQSQQLNQAVVGLRWHNVDQYSRRLQTLTSQILRKPGMMRPRAVPKQEAADVLVRLESGRDGLGRANEGAILAQTLRAMSLSDQRVLSGIMRVEPVIAMRRQAFLNLIQWAEVVFQYRLVDLLEQLVEPDALVDLNANDTQQIQQLLLSLAQDLDGIEYHPYLVNARYCSSELRSAAEKLEDGDTKGCRELMIRSLMSARLKSAQIEIERVIYIILLAVLQKKRSFSWVNSNKRLAEVKRILDSVDETGFVRPVCGQVKNLIQIAILKLGPQKMESLPVIRQDLKDASNLLTGSLA